MRSATSPSACRCGRRAVRVAGREVFVTASVGLAVSEHGDETAEALLRDADAAMYRAKELGGGRYEAFDLSLRHRLVERMAIESGPAPCDRARPARALLPADRSTSPTSDAVGFEALLRWHHPERGLVGPGEFIHIAEETGTDRADRRLGPARRSCAPARALARARSTSRPMCRRVRSGPTLVAEVEQLLAEHRLAPGRLVLEITESLVLDPRDQAGRGGSAGARGAARARRLRHRLLVARQPPALPARCRQARPRAGLVARQDSGVAVVRAAVELGHALGVAVIAEGIETECSWRRCASWDAGWARDSCSPSHSARRPPRPSSTGRRRSRRSDVRRPRCSRCSGTPHRCAVSPSRSSNRRSAQERRTSRCSSWRTSASIPAGRSRSCCLASSCPGSCSRRCSAPRRPDLAPAAGGVG